MKITLKPQEYYYLYSPLRSDPIEMLKYTVQALREEGHVDIFYKDIFINKNAKYKRPRVYFKLGKNYNSENKYSEAESFVLGLLELGELRFYQLKNVVLQKLEKDLFKFKKDYVYKDVYALNVFFLRYFLNKSGRKQRRDCETLMDDLDDNIDLLLKNKEVLNEKIAALGTNIILLNENTLAKLGKTIYALHEWNSFYFEESSSGSGSISFGSSYGSSYGGGGFSGFGGGSFGGGGSGGSW